MRGSLPRFIAAIILIVLVMSSLGCGRRSVAKVDGTKITQDDYYKRLQRHPVNPQIPFPPRVDQQIGSFVLSQMITEQLVLNLAKKEDVSPTKEQLDERKKQLNGALADRGQDLTNLLGTASVQQTELDDRLRPELARSNIIAKYVKVSEDEVKQLYRRFTTDLKGNDKYRSPFYIREGVYLSSISTATRAKIMEAKKQLESGVPFKTVAEQISEDETTKARGGLLGSWFEKEDPVHPRLQGVPDVIYQKAFSTKKRTHSEPFEAAGQWVILRVNDHREGRMQPYDHVKGLLKDQLLQQKAQGNEKIEKLFQGLQKADVKVSVPGYKQLIEERLKEMREAAESVTQKAVPGGTQPAPAAPGGR